MSRLHREITAISIKELVDEYAHCYLLPAFDGDVDASESLSGSLDNQHRGYVAVRMWEVKVSRPAFRVFLSNVWDHDHQYLINAAGTRRRLAAMFRYAAFPAPDLPSTIQVWRGARDVTVKEASEGYSWTLDRDTACWFACRFDDQTPIVITAHIPREQISLFCDSREEREVVLMRPPSESWVDGNVSNWFEGFKRRHEETMAEMEDSIWSYQDLADKVSIQPVIEGGDHD